MRTDQIAIQSYTLREEIALDLLGTLRRLAALGYRAVELASLGDAMSPSLAAALGVGQWTPAGGGGVTAAGLRATLDELGMTATSIHIGFPPEESLGTLADFARTIGAGYAVLAWVPEERRRTAEDVRRLAGYLNKLSAKLGGYGLGFAYHNHDFEFAPLEGSSPSGGQYPFGGPYFYNILAAETDPELVKLELDVYWAAFAGQDPVELIRRYAGRVPLLHAKDMAAGADRDMAAVGSGVLNWPQILSAAQESGTEWYIVEHDRPHDAMQVAESSLRFLRTLAE